MRVVRHSLSAALAIILSWMMLQAPAAPSLDSSIAIAEYLKKSQPANIPERASIASKEGGAARRQCRQHLGHASSHDAAITVALRPIDKEPTDNAYSDLSPRTLHRRQTSNQPRAPPHA